MEIWHADPDPPSSSAGFRGGQPITVWVGTRPVAAGQSVSLRYLATHPGSPPVRDEVPAYWQFNREGCSYWSAELAPLAPGTSFDYHFAGDSHEGATRSDSRRVLVEPSIALALTSVPCSVYPAGLLKTGVGA